MKTVTGPGGFPNKPIRGTHIFPHTTFLGMSAATKPQVTDTQLRTSRWRSTSFSTARRKMKKWAADEMEYRTAFPSPPGFVVFRVTPGRSRPR